MAFVYRKSTHRAAGVAHCGGAMDKTEAGILQPTGVIGALFDDITKQESITGVTDYRLVYLSNDLESLGTIYQPKVRLISQPETKISLGALAKNVQGEAIATERTAPSGVVFKSQADLDRESGGYLTFASGDQLTPGEYCGLWIKRETTASSGSGTITEEFVLETSYGE